MFTFVLTNKEGREVFKFRAQAIFQFDMTDDHTLSVANYKERPEAEDTAPKANGAKAGRRTSSEETGGP